jgi:hypothetical protein
MKTIEWQTIDSQEASAGPTSGSWTEHLCFQIMGDQLWLAVCGHMIAEVPDGWRDADGDWLPAYADEAGELTLPVTINGTSYEGYDGEYLLGELRPVSDDRVIALGGLDRLSVSAALKALDWPLRDARKLFGVLMKK